MIDFLFLDFDGVLHPQYETGPTPKEVCFCHLPRFEAVMRHCPKTRIVISSTWRLAFGLPELRSVFSPDIAQRIVGVTPAYPAEFSPLVAQREWEILQWLEVHQFTGSQWLALDDAFWEFQNHRSRVIRCRGWEGFSEIRAAELLNALQK